MNQDLLACLESCEEEELLTERGGATGVDFKPAGAEGQCYLLTFL